MRRIKLRGHYRKLYEAARQRYKLRERFMSVRRRWRLQKRNIRRLKRENKKIELLHYALQHRINPV